MTEHRRPSALADAEIHNHSLNPEFAQVLDARLSRRGLLRGAVGAAGMGLLGATGLAHAASHGVSKKAAGYLNALGFKPVAKSLADRISLAEGYQYQVIYALGDPLDAQTPPTRTTVPTPTLTAAPVTTTTAWNGLGWMSWTSPAPAPPRAACWPSTTRPPPTRS